MKNVKRHKQQKQENLFNCTGGVMEESQMRKHCMSFSGSSQMETMNFQSAGKA